MRLEATFRGIYDQNIEHRSAYRALWGALDITLNHKMSDYVVYHKAEKMGYPALDVNHLAVYTKKPTAGTAGNRIWLIAGEGTPRRYYLRATFLVKRFERSDRADFSTLIIGTDGQLLDPMPLLNGEKWMRDFVEEQGRFAFGFNQIKNSDAIAGLRSVLAARPRP